MVGTSAAIACSRRFDGKTIAYNVRVSRQYHSPQGSEALSKTTVIAEDKRLLLCGIIHDVEDFPWETVAKIRQDHFCQQLRLGASPRLRTESGLK